VRLWTTDKKVDDNDVNRHLDDVLSSSVNEDSQNVLSCARDRTLRLWDIKSSALVKTSNEQGIVSVCCIAPNGRWYIACGDDFKIKIWETRSMRDSKIAVAELVGHTAKVTACVISRDSKLIVSGSLDKTSKVWRIKDPKHVQQPELLYTLNGHTEGILDVCISEDVKYVVTASQDKTLRIWDTRNGEIYKVLSGHKAAVNACALSSDGKLLVTASEDSSLKLWTVTDNKEPRSFFGTNGYKSVTFSPDAKFIISISNDKVLKIWDTNSEFLVTAINNISCGSLFGDCIVCFGALDYSLYVLRLQVGFKPKKRRFTKQNISSGKRAESCVVS